MTPKQKDHQYDARHETLQHAQRTGQWMEFPGQGGIPLHYHNGRVYASPKSVAAAKRRRNVRMGRQEIENECE